jgi:hypothetical protein
MLSPFSYNRDNNQISVNLFSLFLAQVAELAR